MSEQAPVTYAPTHCPICLERIEVIVTRRLADDGVRRYRRCPGRCYSDRAVLVVEWARLDDEAEA